MFLTGSLWRRQSQQHFNTLTPFNFLFYSLHISAPTGHPQVRYTISYYFCFWRNVSVGLVTASGLDLRGSGRSSSPNRLKNFLFFTSSRQTLGPTQLPSQWVQGSSFPGVKTAGASSWPFTSKQCRGHENVDLYIHFPISLHGVVLS
jgi:hypothetical protein